MLGRGTKNNETKGGKIMLIKSLSRLVRFSLIALIVLSMVGWPLVASAAAKKVVIGFIVKNLVNPFFVAMKNGAEDAGKKLDADVRVYSPENPNDVEAQIRIMEDMVQKKFDAIIIVPTDSRGIIPGIEKANKAGIPVFVSNTRAFGGEFLTFCGISHTEIAQIMTERLCQKMGGKGNMVVLYGVPGAQTTLDKKPGIDAALTKYPAIKVLDWQTGMYQREKAMVVMEDFLARYPNIDGVMAQDDGMALGALEAIKSAGKLKKIVVVGANATPDALKSLKAGELFATIDSAPEKQAFMPTEAAIKYLREGVKPPKEMVVPLSTNVIDASNVDAFMASRGVK
jgi:ribose transport system substrate-binding protein